jgi:hypothetical protein
VKPWVQTPVLQKKKKKNHLMKIMHKFTKSQHNSLGIYGVSMVSKAFWRKSDKSRTPLFCIQFAASVQESDTER